MLNTHIQANYYIDSTAIMFSYENIIACRPLKYSLPGACVDTSKKQCATTKEQLMVGTPIKKD